MVPGALLRRWLLSEGNPQTVTLSAVKKTSFLWKTKKKQMDFLFHWPELPILSDAAFKIFRVSPDSIQASCIQRQRPRGKVGQGPGSGRHSWASLCPFLTEMPLSSPSWNFSQWQLWQKYTYLFWGYTQLHGSKGCTFYRCQPKFLFSQILGFWLSLTAGRWAKLWWVSWLFCKVSRAECEWKHCL